MLAPILRRKHGRPDCLEFRQDFSVRPIDPLRLFSPILLIQSTDSSGLNHGLPSFVESLCQWSFSLQGRSISTLFTLAATYSKYLVNFVEELLIPRRKLLLHTRLGKILLQFHCRRFERLHQFVVDCAFDFLKSIVQVFVPLVFPSQWTWDVGKLRGETTYMILTTMLRGFSETAFLCIWPLCFL